MRSVATPALVLLCLLAAGGKVSADVGAGSTVVQTVISLWKGWSAGPAITGGAPLVLVSKASPVADAPQQQHAVELLFSADDAPADHHRHKYPLHVLTKYIIKPSTGKDFVETFLDVAADSKNQTGSIYYKLFKTASDDLVFYSYQVWATARDFFKHVKSDAVKPLGKLIVDEDIPVFVTAVLPIRKAPHPPHHGPHGPHGPHHGPHGDHPHGPHGPHGGHPHRHGRHEHEDDDHHGPHHGPHGHGGDDHPRRHHHHHRDHEDQEGPQDLDWLSAVMQPVPDKQESLADTARTVLDKIAEQGVAGSESDPDGPLVDAEPPFDLDWHEDVGPSAEEAEQEDAPAWRRWDRKLLHRPFVQEQGVPREHGDDEEDEDDMEEWESSVLAPPSLHMMAFDDTDGNHTHGNRTHYHPTILTKFVVRPSLARFFVGAYMLLKEKVSEEEGNVAFGLAKPLSDNLVFYGYSKWKGPCAIKKHVRKWYTRKFADFIAKANIPIEVTLLAPIEKKANTTMMLPSV